MSNVSPKTGSRVFAATSIRFQTSFLYTNFPPLCETCPQRIAFISLRLTKFCTFRLCQSAAVSDHAILSRNPPECSLSLSNKDTLPSSEFVSFAWLQRADQKGLLDVAFSLPSQVISSSLILQWMGGKVGAARKKFNIPCEHALNLFFDIGLLKMYTSRSSLKRPQTLCRVFRCPCCGVQLRPAGTPEHP